MRTSCLGLLAATALSSAATSQPTSASGAPAPSSANLAVTGSATGAADDERQASAAAPPTVAGVAPASGSNTSNQANNPLQPSVMFSVHDYYVPEIHGVPDRDANAVLLRGLVPHLTFGQPQLFRATLPVSTVPQFPNGHSTGVGDLLLMDLAMFKVKGGSVGLGPVAVLPTGDRTHGSQKWQAGVTAAGAFPRDWGLFGVLGIYQHSVAGKEDRGDVRLLTVQPIIFYNLPSNFYLRSSGILNFDLENGDYYLPVGLGAGRVWRLAPKVRLNTFVEPQYTIAHDGIAPKWQVYAGFNLQYMVR